MSGTKRGLVHPRITRKTLHGPAISSTDWKSFTAVKKHRCSDRDTGDRLLCHTTSRRWSEIRRGHPGHQRRGKYVCHPRATTTATANRKVVGGRKTGDGKNWTEETEVVEEEVFVNQSWIIRRRRIFSISGLTRVSRQSEVAKYCWLEHNLMLTSAYSRCKCM